MAVRQAWFVAAVCGLVTAATAQPGAGTLAAPPATPTSATTPTPTPLTATGPVALIPFSGKPTAEQIIVRALEASGGKAAYDAITSRITTASVTITAKGGAAFASSMVTTQRVPASMVVVTRSEVGGQTRSGTDGRIAWETGESSKPRLIEGTERDAMIRQAMFAAEARPDRFYSRVEVEGAEHVGEHACWVVRLTPREGEPALYAYDQTTGLLVRTRMTIEHPERGRVEMTSVLSDYRAVDGLMLPFRMDTTFSGLPYTSVTEVEIVEHNAKIDDAVFETPTEIKDLLKPPAAADPEGAAPSAPVTPAPATPADPPK